MTDAATRHVVDRCPTCGVEHEHDGVYECEACHTPLRSWCRVHSRQSGWLDGVVCLRCDPHAVPRARPLPPPPPPVPRDDPVEVGGRGRAAAVAPAPDNEQERYEGAAALLRKRLKELEAVEKKVLDLPHTVASPAAAEPAPAVAEPIRPAAARAPEPATGREVDARPRQGVASRLYDAVLTVMWTAIVLTLGGVAVGIGRAIQAGLDVPETAAGYGVGGAMAGVALGVCIAAVGFMESLARRRK